MIKTLRVSAFYASSESGVLAWSIVAKPQVGEAATRGSRCIFVCFFFNSVESVVLVILFTLSGNLITFVFDFRSGLVDENASPSEGNSPKVVQLLFLLFRTGPRSAREVAAILVAWGHD